MAAVGTCCEAIRRLGRGMHPCTGCATPCADAYAMRVPSYSSSWRSSRRPICAQREVGQSSRVTGCAGQDASPQRCQQSPHGNRNACVRHALHVRCPPTTDPAPLCLPDRRRSSAPQLLCPPSAGRNTARARCSRQGEASMEGSGCRCFRAEGCIAAECRAHSSSRGRGGGALPGRPLLTAVA